MEEARKRCAGTPFSQPSAKRPASAATDRASPVSDCSASPYDNGDSSRTSPEPSFVADAEPPELVELGESAEFLLQEQARELRAAIPLLEELNTVLHGAHASAIVLHSAASRGHTWLNRMSLQRHSENAVQPSLLASVPPPAITYVPALPRHLGKSGVLSELQIEAMLYAGQRHRAAVRRSVGPSCRPGFLLADGAGVGKGRTQAAIILDVWLQGQQKALWITASADLLADAKRDLTAVCMSRPGLPKLHEQLISLASIPVHQPIPNARGVLFATYLLLARPARLAQVLAWCHARKTFDGTRQKTFEGVISFDECHKAKAGGNTGAGAAVMRLQADLPLAKVVYASATAATELHNMQYLTRLGLWGFGTPFPSFSAFRDELRAGGAAAQALLPLHLKLSGALVSRVISWEGVRVTVATHRLSTAQREAYDAAARLWLELAEVLLARSHRSLLPPSAGSRFWSAHQRFFRCLVTASKLPTLHSLLDEGLARGKSVVIGLLSTGEAYGTEGGANSTAGSLPPAPSAILKTVISAVLFPNAKTNSADEAEAAAWLRRSEALVLPANPLDDIMRSLADRGVPTVELSGRLDVAAQRNLSRERFQSSAATVAVISDAASTGISLHAIQPPDGGPVRPRLHITLELNWSADRQIQQLGRTHRTGQAGPPEHVLLVSDVCGEKRFVSTVARRLQSLGALSGDGGPSGSGAGGAAPEVRWGDFLESLETASGSAAVLNIYLSFGVRFTGGETMPEELGSSKAALRTYVQRRVQCLPHVRRLLGGRPNVRRATLLTGHVAVGIVLSSSQVKALREALLQERTSPPPMTPPDTTPPERAWSDGAWMDSSGIEASDAPQAWTKSVAEALEQQTRLQLALPPPPPDADDWQPCWADLTHEATALDETELEERQERQQRTSDFQLELMQRRKREQASKREQARADAAPPVPDTAPPMAAPAPPAPLPTDTLVAGAPEVGMARNSRPMPMLPGGRRGPTPAVPPRRVSAEAQRAAAQSKLHPLLQLASMDPADSIATAPSGEPQ